MYKRDKTICFRTIIGMHEHFEHVLQQTWGNKLAYDKALQHGPKHFGMSGTTNHAPMTITQIQ